MSDRDDAGRIYNPDSPFWHKIDLDRLTEDEFTDELSFLCASMSIWLASMGFAITWFPPDANKVCPLPAWMIADAHAQLDPLHRPAEYWADQMVEQSFKAYGAKSGVDDPDAALRDAHEAFEAFLRSREE